MGRQPRLATPAVAPAESAATSDAAPPARPFSNCQMSHRCENSSSPATAAALANSGSKRISPRRCGASDPLRGMPNFCGRSVRMRAMGLIGYSPSFGSRLL